MDRWSGLTLYTVAYFTGMALLAEGRDASLLDHGWDIWLAIVGSWLVPIVVTRRLDHALTAAAFDEANPAHPPQEP